MSELAEQIDYEASIVRTDEPAAPFAVVVRSRGGEEVARKHVKTAEEAEFFLEVLYAVLERKCLELAAVRLH